MLYGKYSFNDLFLPLENETSIEEDVDMGPPPPPSPMHYEISFKSPTHPDLIEFNKISEQVDNLTRRGSSDTFHGFDDPEDWWYGNKERIEPKKKNMLIKINLQFLIHTRYKVYAALAQRELYRQDKRYKMGYLFNRLRRLKTEMRKVVSLATLQNSTNPWYRSLHSLLRYYEQVVRYDVDIRDTSNMVQELYNKEDPADYYRVTFSPPQQP